MIVRPLFVLGAALAWFGSARAADSVAPTQPAPGIETGPAIGWTFPVFTDKEGYHLLTLRGSSARILGPNKIDVTGFSAFAFSGDATEHVDSILLSPQATFFPKENLANGNGPVRLMLFSKNSQTSDPLAPSSDTIEVNGVGWTYDHNTKKVSLAHNVRVTFPAQLNDILK